MPLDFLDTACVMAAAAASVALPGRRGLSGTLLIAFALASLRITGGAGMVGTGLAVESFAISCGIALLGAALLLAQVVGALRAGDSSLVTRACIVSATALALALVARSVVPLAGTGGGFIAVGTAAALLSLGALLRFVGARIPIGHWIAGIDRRLFGFGVPFPGGETWQRADGVAAWVHVLCTVALLLAPHLHLFMPILMVAFASGVWAERGLGRPTIPLTALAVVPAAGIAWYYLAHVGGDQPLGLSDLRNAPYSPAFQLLASLILGLVAVSLLGLWPFHGLPRGPLSPLLGGLLFVRLVATALFDGLFHWQPLLYLLAAIAACHAAVSRRDDEAFAALAALGLASGVPDAGSAGLGFAAAAIVSRLSRLLNERGRVLNRRGRALMAILGIAGSALLLPVLTGGLAVQVFYSTVTVAALALSLTRVAGPDIFATGSPGIARRPSLISRGLRHGAHPAAAAIRLHRSGTAYRRADDADPSRQASRRLREQPQRRARRPRRAAEPSRSRS